MADPGEHGAPQPDPFRRSSPCLSLCFVGLMLICRGACSPPEHRPRRMVASFWPGKTMWFESTKCIFGMRPDWFLVGIAEA